MSTPTINSPTSSVYDFVEPKKNSKLQIDLGKTFAHSIAPTPSPRSLGNSSDGSSASVHSTPAFLSPEASFPLSASPSLGAPFPKPRRAALMGLRLDQTVEVDPTKRVVKKFQISDDEVTVAPVDNSRWELREVEVVRKGEIVSEQLLVSDFQEQNLDDGDYDPDAIMDFDMYSNKSIKVSFQVKGEGGVGAGGARRMSLLDEDNPFAGGVGAGAGGSSPDPVPMKRLSFADLRRQSIPTEQAKHAARTKTMQVVESWNKAGGLGQRALLLKLHDIDKGKPTFEELVGSDVGGIVRSMGYTIVAPMKIRPGKSANAALFIVESGEGAQKLQSVLKVDKIISEKWQNPLEIQHFIMDKTRGDACVRALGRHPRILTTIDVISYNYQSRTLRSSPADDDLLMASTSPLMDGADLPEYIKSVGGKLSPDEIIKIMGQMAEGLAFLNKGGVLHRDVNPNNVRINAEGNVVLFDFGMAKKVGASDQTLLSLDTPYQDPDTATVDNWDAWSLGLLGYEMLTGQTLFKTRWAALEYYESGKELSFPPGTPMLLRQVIQGLLNPKGAKRLSTSEAYDMLSKK